MLYQPSPVEATANVTIATNSITLALANNTLYYFSSSNISYIELTVENDFMYGGFDFATGSTAPTFVYPADGVNDWIFEGADCSGGVFVLGANCRYRVGIEAGFGTYIGTVQRVTIPE